ncbi:hypothetical protein HK105_204498 [Polyrhizophydium stewartii]|uniref:Flavoprotein domain-containing protein n=1 Tax=Polyrhizophydium stewartii TaxID=2732419 RepID=A0ABR4N991_9FUNG
MRVLVGVTGSVASIKLPLLVEQLREAFAVGPFSLDVKVVATKHSLHFFDRAALGDTPVLTDEDEWASWTKMSDPVLHIELRNWADVLVIAPLDANTLAKAAGGLCDNLLARIRPASHAFAPRDLTGAPDRPWDQTKPVVVCPAMNTHMWTHPMTAKHLDVLTRDLGYTVVDPVAKTLACGDVGMGGMASPRDIALAALEATQRNK